MNEHDYRPLPAADYIETLILGCTMEDPVALNDALSRLRAEDFSLDSHQKIFRCIASMSEKGIHVGLPNLRVELEKRRELDAVGGTGYLFHLTERIPRNMSVESYCTILKDKARLRGIIGLCHDFNLRAQDQSEDARDIISDFEERLLELADDRSARDLHAIPDIIRESYSSIDQIYSGGREITGVCTHFTDFDRMTAGLQQEELVIIAARPSMGKTAWAINIAQNAALLDNKVVAVFSLEMSKKQLFERMLASEARVSARKMQAGFIGREQRDQVIRTLERLIETRLFIDDTAGITLTEMRARARRLKQRIGQLDMIVVDYLQLMTGQSSVLRRGANRTEEVSSISRGLKTLAKELKVPVVALSQLSRANEQRSGDKRPILSDLRESGSIEQDADVVAFIHREEYYDRENEDLKGQAEIIVAKQRNGPTGIVNLLYLSDYTLFANPAREY